MPIMPDTRIPLSTITNSGPESSPFQTLGALMEIKEHQQLYDQRRRAAEKELRLKEEDDLVGAVVPQFPKPEDALTHMRTLGPVGVRASIRYGQKLYETRKAELEAQDSELKTGITALGHAGDIAAGVTGQASWDTAVPALKRVLQPTYGDKVADMLPTVYDPAIINALRQSGMKASERLTQQRDLIAAGLDVYKAGMTNAQQFFKQHPELMPEGGMDPNLSIYAPDALDAQEKSREVASRLYSATENQESWDEVTRMLDSRGFPSSVLREFGEWEGPQSRDRAFTLGLPVEKQASGAAAAQGADTRQLQAETAAQREKRLLDAAGQAGGGGAAAAGPTAADQRRWAEENDIEEGITKTEEWVKSEYGARPRKQMPDPKDPTKTVPQPFGYERLDEETKKEYVKRRVSLENRSRTRLQGLPPIQQAAKTAAANGDVEGYNKLREVYAGITNGLDNLEDLVKPPTAAATAGKLAAQARLKQEMPLIIQQLADPSLPPAKRAELQRLQDELIAAAE